MVRIQLTMGLCFLVTALMFSVPPRAAAQQAASSVDMVFVVDESGSMEGEHMFLGNQAVSIDQALQNRNITNNRYGLTAYLGSARQIQVGGDSLGTAQELATATDDLLTSGGTEDGYNAVDFALQNYNFRQDAATAFVLVTDEDRDAENTTLTRNSIFNVLDNRNISLTGILDQELFTSDGQTRALVIQPDGSVAVADGSGGVTLEQNGQVGDGSGNTEEDYTELSLDLDSCVADLNLLREGGDTAASFTEAFLACLALTVEQQGECVDLRAVARTPAARTLANRLVAHQGEGDDLALAVNAIDSICSADGRRATLRDVGGEMLTLQAFGLIQALNAQGFIVPGLGDAGDPDVDRCRR
mgnify:FL=1